mmetsp:Transcript_45002/g.113376  ORF Transcript_45002/g.113376 Transcript_45002/m.113376 type:complete len:266 (+) Transcript_45002:968-1765(+)
MTSQSALCTSALACRVCCLHTCRRAHCTWTCESGQRLQGSVRSSTTTTACGICWVSVLACRAARGHCLRQNRTRTFSLCSTISRATLGLKAATQQTGVRPGARRTAICVCGACGWIGVRSLTCTKTACCTKTRAHSTRVINTKTVLAGQCAIMAAVLWDWLKGIPVRLLVNRGLPPPPAAKGWCVTISTPSTSWLRTHPPTTWVSVCGPGTNMSCLLVAPIRPLHTHTPTHASEATTQHQRQHNTAQRQTTQHIPTARHAARQQA